MTEKWITCPNCGMLMKEGFEYFHPVPQECILELQARIDQLKEFGEVQTNQILKVSEVEWND